MANNTQYAVNVTPTETPTVDYGTASNVLATDIGKSVGGGSTIAIAGSMEDNVGFENGAAVYLEVTNGGSDVLNADTTERSLIVIKNTGYEFSTTAALGSAITKKFTVTMGSKLIAELGAGDIMVLPNAGGGANDLKCSEITVIAEDGTSIACEFTAIPL